MPYQNRRNNAEISKTQPPKRSYLYKLLKRRRIARMRRYTNLANDTLTRMTRMPRQITNNPTINQLFNGSHFY